MAHHASMRFPPMALFGLVAFLAGYADAATIAVTRAVADCRNPIQWSGGTHGAAMGSDKAKPMVTGYWRSRHGGADWGTRQASMPHGPPEGPGAGMAGKQPDTATPDRKLVLGREEHVLFDTNSHTLSTSASASVTLIATVAKLEKAARLRLAGYADTTGPSKHNLLLSRRRVLSVAEALMENGIPAEQICMEAYGETDPPTPTGDDTPAAENRRVTIRFEIRKE